MDSENRKVLGKGTWTLASRSPEARESIPVISLSEQVLNGSTVVHPGEKQAEHGNKEPVCHKTQQSKQTNKTPN